MPTATRGESGNVWRFSTLLATILIVLVSSPLIPTERLGVPFSRILFSAILIAGLYTVSRKRSVFLAGLALALPALATEWVTHLHPQPALLLLNLALLGLFLAYVAAVVFREILREDRVTVDTMFGGICIYVLLGLVWVTIYAGLELLEPGSFLVGGATLEELHPARLEHRFTEFIYFSYVTMTTLGYGDIIPTTGLARAFATSEAITGQLYIAIFVARLVALHLVHQRDHESRG